MTSTVGSLALLWWPLLALGNEGMGDESDKLVTIDVRPGSKTYGKVINTASVPGRNEAHHGGFNDDRTQLWLGGLDTNKIFVFDVKTDPSNPIARRHLSNRWPATGCRERTKRWPAP